MSPPLPPTPNTNPHDGAQDAAAPPTKPPHSALDETLAALDEALSDGLVAFAFLDGDLRFRHVNASLARMHGVSPESHLGRTVVEIIGAEAWESAAPLLRAALDGGTTRDVPLSGSRSANPGEMRHVTASYFPVRSGGAIAGVAFVVRDVTGRVTAERALLEAAERERVFMRDVLLSVTGGKLSLCHGRDELPPRLPVQGDPVPITRHGGIRDLRRQAEGAANALGFAPEGWFDLETAIGEAAMNALVHAGGGVGTVCAGDVAGDGARVQVWVEDQGKGIAIEHLPRATLQPGFTTADTLGHGFKMILKTADCVYLLTGPDGTTVVLEKERDTPATPSAADEW